MAFTPWKMFLKERTHKGRGDGADVIYVGSADNNLYAINPDGTLKWSYKTGDNVYSSPAIAPDGTIYVGSSDNNLYAFNPDGTVKWKYTAGNVVNSSPSMAALVCSSSGKPEATVAKI